MKKILLVDNLSFCRELFSLALTRAGYDTQTASDGLEALDIVKTKKPDLIIMDAKMPNMDGLTTLRVLRSTAEFKTIPVFMLTTLEDRTHILHACQIGVQEYILKSQFALDAMLTRIEKYIGPPKSTAPKPSVESWKSPVPPKPTVANTSSPAKVEIAEIEGEIEADFV
jgi:two-component system, sensor histidine kinase and response regulator